ncbi:MAG: nucleoside hydrolase [Bacteroidota bacterium]
MKTKVLLDTDIGSDIDDAVCLAYLLAHPDCELLGITTVTGEAEKRASIASALCKVAGKDIPILPGAETPLLVPQKQPCAQQAVALHNWEHETKFPRGEAIEFLQHTIRSYPGEVVLLAIAPLTNIGLLFSVDPEIPSLLKGLVMMCGRFSDRVQGNYAPVEGNAAGDPHAAAIVYRSMVASHRSVGVDVTSWVTMSAGEFRKKFREYKLGGPVLDCAEVWFQRFDITTFHDPLAASTIFDEKICKFQRGTVEVKISDEESLGKTCWKEGGANSPHEVAVGVDRERFFEHYFSVLR